MNSDNLSQKVVEFIASIQIAQANLNTSLLFLECQSLAVDLFDYGRELNFRLFFHYEYGLLSLDRSFSLFRFLYSFFFYFLRVSGSVDFDLSESCVLWLLLLLSYQLQLDTGFLCRIDLFVKVVPVRFFDEIVELADAFPDFFRLRDILRGDWEAADMVSVWVPVVRRSVGTYGNCYPSRTMGTN